MLKVKFWRIGNVVCMKVLEQPEELRLGNGKLVCFLNGFSIFSDEFPDINDADSLYIRGSSKKWDYTVVCYDFNEGDQAKEYIERALDAINELNKKYSPAQDTSDDKIEIIVSGNM